MKVRWTLVLLIGALGLASLGAPYIIPGFGNWETISSATLTNVGTTLGLAALLIWLERVLIRHVGETATQAAEAVVDERTEQLREETRTLTARIEELQDQLAEATDRHDRAQDEAIRRLVEGVSFDTVAESMEIANDLNAIHSGQVTVPTASGADAPRVSFFWGEERVDNEWRPAPEPAIHVDMEVLHNPSGGMGIPEVKARWTPEMQVTGHTGAVQLDALGPLCNSSSHNAM